MGQGRRSNAGNNAQVLLPGGFGPGAQGPADSYKVRTYFILVPWYRCGALWNMLRSRDMLPMNAHGVSQFNCNIFYALAHEICGGETDEYNIARV